MDAAVFVAAMEEVPQMKTTVFVAAIEASMLAEGHVTSPQRGRERGRAKVGPRIREIRFAMVV